MNSPPDITKITFFGGDEGHRPLLTVNYITVKARQIYVILVIY